MTKPKYRRLTYDDRRVIENMCKAKYVQLTYQVRMRKLRKME